MHKANAFPKLHFTVMQAEIDHHNEVAAQEKEC